MSILKDYEDELYSDTYVRTIPVKFYAILDGYGECAEMKTYDLFTHDLVIQDDFEGWMGVQEEECGCERENVLKAYWCRIDPDFEKKYLDC